MYLPTHTPQSRKCSDKKSSHLTGEVKVGQGKLLLLPVRLVACMLLGGVVAPALLLASAALVFIPP
jgi:hypothetical protein